MAFVSPQRLINVHGLEARVRQDVMTYLQGCLGTWCNDRSNLGKEFSASTFVGGLNADWKGTPLNALLMHHRNTGKDNKKAMRQAGIDLGKLLKMVVSQDKRDFDTRKSFKARIYIWVG